MTHRAPDLEERPSPWDAGAALRLHRPSAAWRASGILRVRRARGLVGMLVGRCLGLPAEAPAAETELGVEPTARGIQWTRQFGPRQLKTTQHFDADAVLIERVGRLELRFRLVTRREWLVFVQVGAALQLGCRRLPLPRWAAPLVAGGVRCSARLDRLEVRIRLRMPLIGELLRYAGSMNVSTEEWT